MAKNYSIYILKTVFTILLFSSLFISCSNSASGGEEEHEPEGFVIYNNENPIVRQNPSGDLTGVIPLTVSEPESFFIRFLDAEEDEFTPEPAEHSLKFTALQNHEAISITQENPASEPFNFTIEGVQEGTSTFTIALLHLGGTEFLSQEVEVQISSAGN